MALRQDVRSALPPVRTSPAAGPYLAWQQPPGNPSHNALPRACPQGRGAAPEAEVAVQEALRRKCYGGRVGSDGSGAERSGAGIMSGREGGKKKPLKQPKKQTKDLDERAVG
ncbi:translation machinery-associated protein 7 [Phasianus colchicus]|uniref:translation machinery-associated protein 7 n=1 Tax=Phasianus colchicus TaxID=9054 RepID=UPI00129D3A2F|nr:translation machinery-associated protein 7 [Phasianus colchicus]